MNYRVTWEEQPLLELQRLYDAAQDKEGVVNSVARVGLELAANPFDAGESRERGKRVVFKYPLICWFYVIERTRSVVIYQVRPWRR